VGKVVFKKCGCKFDAPTLPADEILHVDKYDRVIHPGVTPDIYNLNLECPETWKLLAAGDTKSVFQLESYLGRHWAEELKPENLEHLSALVSIIRPGVLKAKMGNPPKSATELYCSRKNKTEEITPYQPDFDETVKDTYGLLIYQEAAIQLARTLAGFTEERADVLRKGIAKKDTKLMSKLEAEFIDGCIKTGKVTKEQASEIFDNIRVAQRYSFNKSILSSTKVCTKDKIKSIKQLQIGEYIETPEGYAKVLNKYDHGTQDVYKITLDNNKQISCTLQHKFLCEDNVTRPLYRIINTTHKIVCKE
jgi:hypothetical protein